MTKKREYTVVRECTAMGAIGGSGLAGGLMAMALNRRNLRGFIPGALLTALSVAYAWLMFSVIREDRQQAKTQEEKHGKTELREEHELGENYVAAGAVLSGGLVSGLALTVSGRRQARPWRRRSGMLTLGLTGLFGGLVSMLVSSFRMDARNERPVD